LGTEHPLKQREARRTGRKRAFLRWSALLGALILCLLTLDYWAYPYGLAPGGKSFNRGENGLWMRYPWYFGQHTDLETQKLALKLQQLQIRYAYFHVRSITRTGKLAFHYPDQARRLVSTLHRTAPGVKVIAWVYVGNELGEGKVHLGDAAVRKAMNSEALWLVNTCGFDGVQWDYEVCINGDKDYLTLLKETRAVLPPNKLLSVATAIRLPLPRWGWSDAYFSQVARYCDQMAVMCYDTGFYLPRSYVWLVGQQAIHIPEDAVRTNPHCRVLLGIPTYGPGLASHNPHAENIRMALRGVREGLAAARSPSAGFAGVAIFAEYTTKASDWDAYRAFWLDP
jgi:hypothetical protein